MDETDKRDLIIYVSSKMETVFFGEGLADENLSRLLDRMLSSFFIFSSHGSGWILRKFNVIGGQLILQLPISGSSCLDLPSALQKFNCLNNRKCDDNDCFFYCFIAAWHFKRGLSLHKKVCWCLRSSF